DHFSVICLSIMLSVLVSSLEDRCTLKRTTAEHKNHNPNSSYTARLCRLVVVSFGLLCIFQATLNISLRLFFCDAAFPTSLIVGWVYFRGSFYYISSIKKSWNDSREDCLQRGADLVIISSREEQVQCLRVKSVWYTWIGMTDTEEEGTWKWVDGTLLDKSFRYWHTGEPNNYNGLEEDCGEIKLVEDENKWNDIECNTENFWICEKMVDL
uniref:C-type lectin domain-containing protein n=1 Tax=Amphilophus citrinellus TaxID=61819 RepID=A0A3Q0RFC5_AMPCI